MYLAPLGTTAIADLEVVKLSLELLDGTVSGLEVLVEAVAFGDELLSDGDQRQAGGGKVSRDVHVAPTA